LSSSTLARKVMRGGAKHSLSNNTDSECDGKHPHQHDVNEPKKPKFEHQKKGGVMKFCPNATDCSQMVMIKMKKLREINAAGQSVGNQASVFADREFEWSTPVQESIDGVNRTKVECMANITVGNATTPTSFHLTTFIYDTNGTSQNANLTLDIPQGSFKFAINITDWPWKSINNSLQFGIDTKIITKDGNWTKTKDKIKREKVANKQNLEKVEFGDGMYMEAPEICDRDGEPALLNTTIEPAEPDGIFMDFNFPYFGTYLYYDPVFATDDQVTEESTDTGTTNTNTNTTTTEDQKAGAATLNLSFMLSLSVLVLSALWM